jgi:16S rRNA (guanine527-N7)-methyltransferase
MNAAQVVAQAEAVFKLSISPHQQDQLQEYVQHLRSWSGRVRLISRNDRDLIWERHILDSLSLVPRIPDHGAFLDLGSGAGLPGIPVAILCPDLEVVLLEPSRMKALFLVEMVSVLGLHNTRAIRSRAEALASHTSMRGKFQFATARAVAALPKLWDWINPLLAPDGVFVAMKGPGALTEFSAKMPSGVHVEEEEATLPLTGRPRSFVSIKRCFT